MWNNTSQKGFTIVELLVATSIMVIIVTMSTEFIVTGMNSLRYGREFEEAVSNGRRAVEDISREIRGANTSARGDYPISQADDQVLAFYSDTDYDNDYDLVRYYVTDRVLYKSVTDPGASRDYAGAAVITAIADYVNNGGQEIFRYYDSDAVETTDLDSIRMVNMQLLFNVNPGVAPDDILVETDVQLRNLKSNL